MRLIFFSDLISIGRTCSWSSITKSSSPCSFLSQRKLLSYRENLKFSFKVFKIKRLFFWYSLKSLSKTLKKSLRCDSFWIIMHFVCIAKVNFHIVFLAWEYLRLVCSKRFLDQYSHMRAHKNFLYL